MAVVTLASDIEAWRPYHVVHSIYQMLKGRGCWEPSHSTLEREKARKYKSPRLRPRSPESTIVARCNKKCFLFIYHFYFAAKNQAAAAAAAAAAQVSVLIGAQFRSAALNRSARTSSSSATSPSLEVRVHRGHQHQQHQHQHYDPQRRHLLQQQHEEAAT